MKDPLNELKPLYTTIFSQKFNSDGTELAVSDNFGQIGVYKLCDVLSADNINKIKLPYFKFKAANSSLYSLESKNDILICSPLNEIVGFKWKDFGKSRNTIKQSFNIKLPLDNDGRGMNTSIETNSLICDSNNETKRLFAGCGNGIIYNYDLEYSKLINKFDAHKYSIYQLALKNNGNELVSCSEDGDVKIWDLREKDSIITIKPYEDQMCTRPPLGKYINCVAIDEDNWLICGGGPRLSMWHLRLLKPMSVLEFDDAHFVPNVCRIHDNQIITGGNSTNLYCHTFENKLKTEMKTSSISIYDISINKSSKINKILCAAGSSTMIDICSNFSYRAFSLNF